MATTTIDITRALAIEGWMTRAELQWLAERASEHRVIVELGSYLGRSTRALADATEGTVYAIDDWGGPRELEMAKSERASLFPRFLRNVDDLPSLRLAPIQSRHEDVRWDGPTPDMVFIDGSHDYPSVKRDLAYWLGKIPPDGLLCGHDASWTGVRLALDELLPGQWEKVPDTDIWMRKEGALPAALKTVDVAELVAQEKAREDDGLEWSNLGGSAPTNISVAVAIPSGHGRNIPLEWAIGLAIMTPPCNSNYVFLPIKGMKRDLARIALVKQAQKLNARRLLFIDDDTVPPPEVIAKLMFALDNADDDVKVVGGIYCSKTEPPFPMVFEDEGTGPFWKWKVGDVFPVGRIGTGCMMIDMKVFDMLPEPWFADIDGVDEARAAGLYQNGRVPLGVKITDDMYFCKKVREARFRILAHGGVLCDHYGQDGRVYRLPSDSYPMRPRG